MLAPAMSIAAIRPTTTMTAKKVRRPSLDRSLGGRWRRGAGMGGAGGAGTCEANGPCGANGGRYPPLYGGGGATGSVIGCVAVAAAGAVVAKRAVSKSAAAGGGGVPGAGLG